MCIRDRSFSSPPPLSTALLPAALAALPPLAALLTGLSLAPSSSSSSALAAAFSRDALFELMISAAREMHCRFCVGSRSFHSVAAAFSTARELASGSAARIRGRS